MVTMWALRKLVGWPITKTSSIPGAVLFNLREWFEAKITDPSGVWLGEENRIYLSKDLKRLPWLLLQSLVMCLYPLASKAQGRKHRLWYYYHNPSHLCASCNTFRQISRSRPFAFFFPLSKKIHPSLFWSNTHTPFQAKRNLEKKKHVEFPR